VRYKKSYTVKKVPEAVAGMKNKILVIEDDRAISELLCMNLEAAGYETVAAYDGEEAQNEEEMGLVILKAIQENGEEILSTLDSDEEIDAVYNEFMKELFAEEEEAPE